MQHAPHKHINAASFTDIFARAMDKFFLDGLSQKDIAVAVSGGADSMALCFALSAYFMQQDKTITLHALTVDHGLRIEAADEALHVRQQLQNLPNVTHNILTWSHTQKPTTRIQEHARIARYKLMHTYMRAQNITHLFLGHHREDQAETFLFRLAKGSGLDGLACMTPHQKKQNNFILCRPLLGLHKADMVAFCAEKKIAVINDPSNESLDFARVRLRKSMDILAAEGLSAKRLSVSATRFSRARAALEQIATGVFKHCVIHQDLNTCTLNHALLMQNPEEIILRVIMQAMSVLTPDQTYGARLERIENLCLDLSNAANKPFRKRTLGGLIFTHNTTDKTLILSLEK